MPSVKIRQVRGARRTEAKIVTSDTSKQIVLRRHSKIIDSACLPGQHTLWLSFASAGEVFIALEGATFDGFSFIEDSIPERYLAWEYQIDVE